MAMCAGACEKQADVPWGQIGQDGSEVRQVRSPREHGRAKPLEMLVHRVVRVPP
jgi:hypothetical protein